MGEIRIYTNRVSSKESRGNYSMHTVDENMTI